MEFKCVVGGILSKCEEIGIAKARECFGKRNVTTARPSFYLILSMVDISRHVLYSSNTVQELLEKFQTCPDRGKKGVENWGKRRGKK